MPLHGLPGYKVSDYMIVIELPQELKEQVLKVKKKFALDYRANQALSPPFILLSAFQGLCLSEERMTSRLAAALRPIAPLKIELSDYGSFPSHSIYINIPSKVAVSRLVKELKKMQSLLKLDNEHTPYFIDDAHLAICRKLRPWQYEKAWLEYSHMEFTGRFIARSMQLLRKEEGKEHFEIAGTFLFEGKEEKTKQGDLFN